MSMDEYSYNGYGIDLGDISLNEGINNNLLNAISVNFMDLVDLAPINEDRTLFESPCNTDSFEALIYIPEIPLVSEKPMQIRQMSVTEANKLLADEITKLAKYYLNEYTDKADIIKEFNSIDWKKFRNDILQAVKDNADFSYNKSWHDYC